MTMYLVSGCETSPILAPFSFLYAFIGQVGMLNTFVEHLDITNYNLRNINMIDELNTFYHILNQQCI